ncbi:MAG TPA: histidine kinase dimerization/phospho-acceptor domain-containing protein, partial [Chloroflexota bacterium]|nr:histidine kinase dimerization/phospho-acceptor domain-containing protein [Chloroflexota bacterium]
MDYDLASCVTVEEAPEAERARLELLLNTARVLGSSLDRAGILNSLAKSIISGLHAAAALFTDVDLTTGALKSVIHHVAPGRAPMVTSPDWALLAAYPFLECIVRSGAPTSAHITDRDLPESERAFLAKHGLRAEVVAPILSEGRISSLLEVFWDHPNSVGPHTVAVCAAIAEQATVALENARLYKVEADLRQRAETRARRLEHVQRIGEQLKADLDPDEIARRVVDAARAATGFRMVVLNLVNDPDEPDSLWRVVATAGIPPEGIEVLCASTYTNADAHKLLRSEFRISRSYFIPNHLGHLVLGDTDVPSWWAEAKQPIVGDNAWHTGDDLLVPLTEREENRMIGFLSLDEPESGLRPEREEVELLEIFADQTVVALRNAYLLRQARQDALERTRTEEIVRASEARLRAVLSSSPILLFSLDTHGRFTLATGGDLELLGMRVGDLPGRQIGHAFAHRPEITAYYVRALAGEAHSVTIDIRETSLEMHWTPLRAEDGVVTGVIGVAVDVTERVLAQRAAEALACLRSDFVASVSHELRTPLTAIVGYAELLQSRWDVLSEERRLEHISRIVTSANRQKRM